MILFIRLKKQSKNLLIAKYKDFHLLLLLDKKLFANDILMEKVI